MFLFSAKIFSLSNVPSIYSVMKPNWLLHDTVTWCHRPSAILVFNGRTTDPLKVAKSSNVTEEGEIATRYWAALMSVDDL